jgi:hypothetical protein
MIDDEATNNIIAWQSDGASFQIKDRENLTEKVLPEHFRHRHYTSFQRQLNHFGFSCWRKAKGGTLYKAKLFTRDKPENASMMSRRKSGLTKLFTRDKPENANMMSRRKSGLTASDDSTATLLPHAEVQKDSLPQILASARMATTKFLLNLRQVVDDIGNCSTVSWSPNGDAFQIRDILAFVQHIMPTYFADMDYLGFQHQLTALGFACCQTKGIHAYANAFFRKDNLAATLEIVDRLNLPLEQNHTASTNQSTSGAQETQEQYKIGIYDPEQRKARIRKFHEKRRRRNWSKKVKYSCRKKSAAIRPRVKGRFAKSSDDLEEGDNPSGDYKSERREEEEGGIEGGIHALEEGGIDDLSHDLPDMNPGMGNMMDDVAVHPNEPYIEQRMDHATAMEALLRHTSSGMHEPEVLREYHTTESADCASAFSQSIAVVHHQGIPMDDVGTVV